MQDSHENFLQLKAEKRDKIINAALLEFAEKGYDLASTNSIVGAAGISKGSLFHYFQSKKELFLFLCDYVFDTARREFYEQIGHSNGDIMTRYSRAARLKGTLYLHYPMIFDFIQRLTREKSPEIAAELAEKLAGASKLGYDHLLENLDESLFRTDVPVDKLRELTVWALENYGRRSQELIGNKKIEDIDLDTLNEDFDQYVEVLRKCFYRQEGQ